jgi:ABC-type transporter Mla maintaining outer membrane lipid asymmetry permease subunit MlaE
MNYSGYPASWWLAMALVCVAALLVVALFCALFGGFCVAVVWWWCNTFLREVDQKDFDNEAHWHKRSEIQSKRGDL